MLASVPAFVARIDEDFVIRDLNRSVHAPVEQFIGHSIFDFIDAEHHEGTRASLGRVIETGEPVSVDVTIGMAEVGRIFAMHVERVQIPGEAPQVCVTARNVDEERRNLAELERSTGRLALALSSTEMAWWELDLRTNELTWSPEMHELTGEPVPLAHDAFTERLIHPDDRALSLENMRELQETGSFKGETRIVVDGETRWVHSSGRRQDDEQGRPIRVVGGLLDVTRERRLSEQLWHAERMALIGELTAGVAHNFNNVLMALTPTLELIAAEGDEDSVARANAALGVTRRAATIVGQLLSVAGKQATRTPEAVDLVPVVAESVEICRRMFPRQITIDFMPDLEPDAVRPRVVALADEDQVTQVVMNLLLNARDAFGSAGALCKASADGTSDCCRDGRSPHIEVTVAPCADDRSRVEITVADNGKGVPEALRDRLFEPFVSSKGAAGTGLGLASCAAIAKQLGGEMRVDHRAEGGAAFSMRLPAASPAATREISKTTPSDGERAGQSVEGVSVLLVEDEPVIRESVATILRRRGATVAATASVDATFTWLESDRPEIDVVLLDRSLPGRSGVELVPRLRSELPGAAILFFTGEPVPEDQANAVDGVIAKPIRARELVARIAEVAAKPED